MRNICRASNKSNRGISKISNLFLVLFEKNRLPFRKTSIRHRPARKKAGKSMPYPILYVYTLPCNSYFGQGHYCRPGSWNDTVPFVKYNQQILYRVFLIKSRLSCGINNSFIFGRRGASWRLPLDHFEIPVWRVITPICVPSKRP